LPRFEERSVSTRTDRRVRKTRRQLHEALLSQILEKKYDSITVQDVLDRADVGRSTFYAHFRGKDELLVAGFQNLKTLLEAAESSAVAPAERRYERIVAGSGLMFEHAEKYGDVHRALYGSQAEAIVRRNLHAVFYEVIARRVAFEMRHTRIRNRAISTEMLTLFLVSTQTAILNWWLGAREPLQALEVDAVYRSLVMPVLASLFEPAAPRGARV
jgi:AcrR family transcriptional regulator